MFVPVGTCISLDTSSDNCYRRIRSQARSSGGERYPDTVEVAGSNPAVPTSNRLGLTLQPPLFGAATLLKLVSQTNRKHVRLVGHLGVKIGASFCELNLWFCA
jgi:hypothetical protein